MGSFIKIPMSSAASFSESLTLDDNEYQLSFAWNTRGGYWTMGIADANGISLCEGVRLCISYPLNIQHTQTAMPKGVFLVVDTNPKTAMIEPGRMDFVQGRNLELLYASK